MQCGTEYSSDNGESGSDSECRKRTDGMPRQQHNAEWQHRGQCNEFNMDCTEW